MKGSSTVSGVVLPLEVEGSNPVVDIGEFK